MIGAHSIFSLSFSFSSLLLPFILLVSPIPPCLPTPPPFHPPIPSCLPTLPPFHPPSTSYPSLPLHFSSLPSSLCLPNTHPPQLLLPGHPCLSSSNISLEYFFTVLYRTTICWYFPSTPFLFIFSIPLAYPFFLTFLNPFLFPCNLSFFSSPPFFLHWPPFSSPHLLYLLPFFIYFHFFLSSIFSR